MRTTSELRQRFAELYPTTNDARRIARDAGIDTTRVEFLGTSLLTWANLLQSATDQGKFSRLIETISKEYPDIRETVTNFAEEFKSDTEASAGSSLAYSADKGPSIEPDAGAEPNASAAKPDGLTDAALDSFFKPRSEATSFTTLVRNGTTFWIAAKGASGFLNRNAKVIERGAELGKRFRFILHDPNNFSMLYAISSNSYSNQDPKKLKSMILGAITQLKTISAKCEPGTVEIRLAQAPLYNGYTIVDGEHQNGIIYLEMFGFKTSLDERLTLTVSRISAPKLYKYHFAQFDDIWAASKPA